MPYLTIALFLLFVMSPPLIPLTVAGVRWIVVGVRAIANLRPKRALAAASVGAA